MKAKTKKRYQPLKRYKGIRKDLWNGRYCVMKTINGKQYSTYCDTIPEAVSWRNTFHPSLALDKREKKRRTIGSKIKAKFKNHVDRANGQDIGLNFSDLWELYQQQHLPSLEWSTAENILSKRAFYDGLMNFKMIQITPFLIDDYILKKKEESIKNPRSNRCNFNNDLKNMKAILNWYRENYDPFFVNPVLKRHYVAGKIKNVPIREKKMSKDEVIAFFNSFDSIFWRDFAETHFYITGRAQEAAGLQLSSINFEDSSLEIKYVVVWCRKSKKFEYLKDTPKNGEVRFCHIGPHLKQILQRRLREAVEGCSYLFHDSGAPINYRQIQYHYNKALRRAGLSDRFSSTHILRHSKATIARKVAGLDGAQASGGWKDQKVLQGYASLPEEANVDATMKVEEYMYHDDTFEEGNVLRLVK